MSFQINRRRGPLTAPPPKPEYVGCHGTKTPHRFRFTDNTNGPLAHGVCQNCGHEKSLKNYLVEGDATMPYLTSHERALFGKEEWNG